MKTFRYLSIIAIALTIVYSPPTVLADSSQPDPQQIAQQCLEQMAARTQAGVQENAQRAFICTQKIEMLLANGHPAKAVFVASECNQRTIARSQARIHYLNTRSAACSLVLLELDAPLLAEVVNEAKAEAVAAINMSRQASIQAVLAALFG